MLQNYIKNKIYLIKRNAKTKNKTKVEKVEKKYTKIGKCGKQRLNTCHGNCKSKP